MTLGKPTPILRIFDEAKAREFYLDFLGFKQDWQHRLDDAQPLYLQVSRGECVLHLTEHYGDCSPGAALRIPVVGLDSLGARATCRSRTRSETASPSPS